MKDISIAKKQNVAIIWTPTVDDMYPEGYKTYIEVEAMGKVLCGQTRPNHFRGVTTIVAKLLNVVLPDRMYLGQKDAQQVIVLKKMIEDLNIPVEVKMCPTIREHDGLAMSSRNMYLTAQERKEAPIIFQSLQHAKKLISKGERTSTTIIRAVRSMITSKPHVKVDYIECVDGQTLTSLKQLKNTVLIAVAVWFGKTRLIDNAIVSIK
jgi:pantoate--beta-alanine ligase